MKPTRRSSTPKEPANRPSIPFQPSPLHPPSSPLNHSGTRTAGWTSWSWPHCSQNARLVPCRGKQQRKVYDEQDRHRFGNSGRCATAAAGLANMGAPDVEVAGIDLAVGIAIGSEGGAGLADRLAPEHVVRGINRAAVVVIAEDASDVKRYRGRRIAGSKVQAAAESRQARGIEGPVDTGTGGDDFERLAG